MTMLETFSRLVGVERHNAEDALRSERAGKAVLSRRGFFAAGAALAAGVAFSEGGLPAQALRARVHVPFYDTLVRMGALPLIFPGLVLSVGLFARAEQ